MVCQLPQQLFPVNPYVGADGYGWEVNLPYGVVGVSNGYHGWVVCVLLINGPAKPEGGPKTQDTARHPENSVGWRNIIIYQANQISMAYKSQSDFLVTKLNLPP